LESQVLCSFWRIPSTLVSSLTTTVSPLCFYPSHPFIPHGSSYIIYIDDINNLSRPCPGHYVCNAVFMTAIFNFGEAPSRYLYPNWLFTFYNVFQLPRVLRRRGYTYKFKGSVQQTLRWVKSSANCWVLASDRDAGQYFAFLICGYTPPLTARVPRPPPAPNQLEKDRNTSADLLVFPYTRVRNV
jgi:hypothetical protein